MNRKECLMDCFKEMDKENLILIENLIDEIVYLEGELTEVKKLPFLKVHPENPYMQKATPAGRLYATLISKYTDIVTKLSKILGKDDKEGDSPLREYMKKIQQNE